MINKTYPVNSTEEFKSNLKNMAKKYNIYNNLLFYKKDPESENLEVLHEGNVEQIIQLVHSEGHMGINTTWYKVKSRYYSPNKLFEVVKDVLKNCETCQYRKRKPAKRTVPAKPILTPSVPFHMIACDAVGPVIESNRRHRNILVAVDYLTRWPIAKAVKRIDEETVIDFMVTEVLQDYGVPKYLLTDRGSSFLSKYSKSFFKQI